MRNRLAIASTLLCAVNVSFAAGPVEKVKVQAVASFGFDRAAVTATDRDRLLAEVAQMKDVSWQTVTATGYTDDTGPAPYNQQLSERRAQAVKTFLVGKGLAAEMIRTAGQGEQAPVAGNDTPQGRAQNRRTVVEFEGVRQAK